MPANLQSANAYEILGLAPDAAAAAVRRAYIRLLREHHPDVVGPRQKAQAAVLCAQIILAYERLRSPEHRRKYDGLLKRGILPDLNQEVGGVPLPRLADILGEIQSLNLPGWGPGNESVDFNGVHFPNLIVTPEVQESIVGWFPVPRLESRGLELPAGEQARGCLLITPLRLILGMVFHRPGAGTFSHILYSFYWTSLQDLVVHETGRLGPDYALELKDEDGAWLWFHLPEPNTPYLQTFSLLFLIANAYRLPVRVCTPTDLFRPFLLGMLGLFCLSIPLIAAKVLSDGLAGVGWLTAYLVPLLLLFPGSWIFLYYGIRRAHQVCGPLALDYAAGVPDMQQVRQEPAVRPREAPRLPPQPAPPPQSECNAPPVAEGPTDVEIPEAVREALRREKPPE